MIPPPKYRSRAAGPPRRYPRDLSKVFAADVFDIRFVNGPSTDRQTTSAGYCINVYHWCREHRQELGPAIDPVLTSLREWMQRDFPDVWADLERHAK